MSVDEPQAQLVRAAGFGLVILFALILERLRPHGRMRPSWRVNLGLWLVGAVTTAVVCGACGIAAAHFSADRSLGVLSRISAPGWAEILVTVVLLDLVSYGWHRANHRVALLWRFHRVHHADETFTATTSVRFHPGELLLSMPVRLAAIIALAPTAGAVLLFELLYTAANVLEHSDVDLPPALERALSKVLVVPALHRRHHSQTRSELDSNFGTIFVVWDRWLATFGTSSSRDRYEIGLPDAGSRTAVHALLMPFRTAERGFMP